MEKFVGAFWFLQWIKNFDDGSRADENFRESVTAR